MSKDTYIIVEEERGPGCLGIALCIAGIFAVIGAILAIVFEALRRLIFVIFTIVANVIGAAAGLFLTLTVLWACVLLIKNIVFSVRDAIKNTASYRSPVANGFVNFLRQMGGFLKDMLVLYCTYNSDSIKEKYNSMKDPHAHLIKKAFRFLIMCNLVMVAFGSPIIFLISAIFYGHYQPYVVMISDLLYFGYESFINIFKIGSTLMDTGAEVLTEAMTEMYPYG